MSDFTDSTIFPYITYRNIIEQIQDGIYVTNRDRRIVYWNTGAEKLLGYSREEILGKRCRDRGILCGGKNEEAFSCTENGCPIIRAIEAGFTGTYPHIVFMQGRDGIEIPVSLNVSPVRDDAGETVGGICVFRDVRDEYRQRLLAGEVQKRMNTSGSFRKNGVRVQALYEPVDEVGGDLVEVFFHDSSNLFVSVADATGHGISAALFIMIYRTLLHSSLSRRKNPGAILAWINGRFAEISPVEGFYLTASLVRIDLTSGRGLYASAGHPPSLVYERESDGPWQLRRLLSTHGMLIGADPGANYPDTEFSFRGNDMLIMGTDGLFESETGDGTFFGIHGITRFMQNYTGDDTARDLHEELKRTSRYVDLTDDVGIVAVKLEEHAVPWTAVSEDEP